MYLPSVVAIKPWVERCIASLINKHNNRKHYRHSGKQKVKKKPVIRIAKCSGIRP